MGRNDAGKIEPKISIGLTKCNGGLGVGPVKPLPLHGPGRSILIWSNEMRERGCQLSQILGFVLEKLSVAPDQSNGSWKATSKS